MASTIRISPGISNNLDLVLKDLVDYPTTRAKYERALRIDEATFGLTTPRLSID